MSERPRAGLVPRHIWLVAGVGWVLFGLGILSFIFLYFRHAGSSVPKVGWHSRWGQAQWVTFRDPEGKFLLDYPSTWDMSAPFERFTRHRVGTLVALDTVALRHAYPTGLAVVIRYLAPRPLSGPEWFQLTQAGGPLADAFGERIRSRQPAHLAGHAALAVAGEGVVVDKMYRLESWLIPDGPNAYRLTIGAPLDEFARAAPTLHRIAASFRFTGAARRVSELTRRHGG